MVTDYLNNREQHVVLPGSISSWTSIKAGAPQGSILGHLLFLFFINDIVESVLSSKALYSRHKSINSGSNEYQQSMFRAEI